MTIPAIRTPESSFDATRSDFPYPPKYLENVVEGLRIAYYDIPAVAKNNNDDKENNPVFLCLHGEPTWSYLYRHMIPVFNGGTGGGIGGGRVICVDLIGLGRSDKPTSKSDYSFSVHRAALLAVVERLDLKNITLVVQDWGGILGLTLPLEAPDRYSRLLMMNTMLPIEPESSKLVFDLKSNDAKSGFAAWHNFTQASEDWDVGHLVNLTCKKNLSPEVVAAYNAPFPSPVHRAGVNVFTTLVPFSNTQDGYAVGREALHFWKHRWNGSTFMAVGAKDRVIPPAIMHRMASNIRGCAAPLILPNTSHFVQEQSGEQVAKAAIDHFARSARRLSKF